MKAKNKLKKIFAVLFAVTLALTVLSLFACSDKEEEAVAEVPIEVRGVYKNLESERELQVTLTTDSSLVQGQHKQYLSCSVYPFSGASGQRIAYNVIQQLTLRKDFTYRYDYSVELGTFAKYEVRMIGTFYYTPAETATKTVTLRNPESGYQRIYGFTGGSNASAWTMSSVPTFTADVETIRDRDDLNLGKYLSGRKVRVNKGATVDEKSYNILYDDIFYGDLFDEICKYSSVN